MRDAHCLQMHAACSSTGVKAACEQAAWPRVLQERQAAARRAEADQQRAKVTGQMQKLQQALEAMQQACATQQEAVLQELQRDKLQRQVDLQVTEN
jgi:hypothetical protein